MLVSKADMLHPLTHSTPPPSRCYLLWGGLETTFQLELRPTWIGFLGEDLKLELIVKAAGKPKIRDHHPWFWILQIYHTLGPPWMSGKNACRFGWRCLWAFQSTGMMNLPDCVLFVQWKKYAPLVPKHALDLSSCRWYSTTTGLPPQKPREKEGFHQFYLLQLWLYNYIIRLIILYYLLYVYIYI